MQSPRKSALAAHRERMARRGYVRVEINVRREDAGLVREVAAALSSPDRRDELRRLLQDRFGGIRAVGLKALLAAAPLEGIELDRSRETGRDIEL